MKPSERKHRFALPLLFSLVVFLIILAAAGLAVGFLFLALHFGLIGSIDGMLQVGEVLLFMLLISTVLGFLLSILAGKLTLKPINRILDRLDRLSHGDFKVRIRFGRPLRSIPAFRDIEESFNKAAEELSHTETLRADFINNFSHEFKTPIVSIAGFAKLLQSDSLTDEERKEYLRVIEEESLRLSALATNTLQMTKIENQTILTDTVSFNLSEQIRGVVLLLEDRWSAKHLEPTLECREHTICANEELLRQVWINLLDNAIKFADDGSMLRVTIVEQKEALSVSVSNQGPTIPEDSLPHLFRKYYQADESHASAGHGLGLAIVKKIVDLHSGTVTVRSEDAQTTFTVTLPFRT